MIIISIYIPYRSTNIFIIIIGNPTAVISKLKNLRDEKKPLGIILI